jgi:peptidoglycan/xylan/chitin deacetylase (PgdA/CDA1 family)
MRSLRSGHQTTGSVLTESRWSHGGSLLALLALVVTGASLLLAACGQQQSPPDPRVLAEDASPSPVSRLSLLAVTAWPTRVVLPSPTATDTALPDERLLPRRPAPQPSPVLVAETETAASPTPTIQEPAPLPSPSGTAKRLPVLPTVEPGLIRHGDRSRPLVALTFDACQSSERETGYDAAIIRTLTETQTAATLFLGGLWVQSHLTQTQVLAAVPYFELGNHSWSHLNFAELPTEEITAEITKTQEILVRVTGRVPTLFRLPGGTYGPGALEVIAGLGLRAIQWDVVTGDPNPNVLAEDIVRAVTTRAQNGSIVIMHMNGRGWHTAEALPAIIDELSRQGFRFVTISELLDGSTGGATP